MEMLLVTAAASWLLLSAPLASGSAAAAYRYRPPRAGSYARPSYTTPSSQQYVGNKFNKYAPGIIQNLLPPSPPDEGSSSTGPPPDESSRGGTPAVYIVGLEVGTPPQIITGILDISTQLVWMQCAPCTACLTPPSYTFQPDKSKTYNSVTCCDNDPSCGYNVTYSDTASTTGYLVNDTFNFGATPEDGMVFGCSDSTTTGDYSGASGVIGFGRGPLSLVSQLRLYNFSYFLAPNGVAVVQLNGVVAVPPRTGRSRSTPLLKGTVYTDPYYIGLTGIHVDGNELDIPVGTFDLRNDGSGGVFLSTTEPFTYILSDAYTAVRQAFASSIPQQPTSRDDLDPLCYTVQSSMGRGVKVPRLTLVFDGEDVTMELSKENYFFTFNDGDRDLECLTVLPSTGVSLLGSLLQTGTMMIYDLVGQQLTFVEYGASPPPAPLASESEALASPSLAMIVALALPMMLF